MGRESYVTKKKYIGGRAVFIKTGTQSLTPVSTRKIGGRITQIPYDRPSTSESGSIMPSEKVSKASQEQVYSELARSFGRM